MRSEEKMKREKGNIESVGFAYIELLSSPPPFSPKFRAEREREREKREKGARKEYN